MQQDAIVEGSIWAAGDVSLTQVTQVQGDIVSEGSVSITFGVTVAGDITAVGTVTVHPDATVTGTVQAGQSTVPDTPPVPPVEFVSSGPTAIITVAELYRVSITVGGITIECDVWIATDPDVGDYLDGCEGGAATTIIPPTPTAGPTATPTSVPTATATPGPTPTATPAPTPAPFPTSTDPGFTWFTDAADISLSTTTGGWQDIDLSSYVPSAATGAVIEIINAHPSVGYSGVLRGKEDTRDYMSSAAYGKVEGKTHRWQIVKMNSSRIVQGYIEDLNIDFRLQAYTMGTDPTYFAVPSDISPGSTAAWTTVDVSGSVDADTTGVMLFIESVTSSVMVYGVREVGSSYATTTRTLQGYGSSMYLVGIDGSDQFEAYIEASSVNIYLVGQTKSSVVYYTNDTAATYPSVGSWQELDADTHSVPAEATGLIFLVEMDTDLGDGKVGLRHGDSTRDYNSDVGSGTHLQAGIGINSSNVWDEYLELTSASVLIAGYTKPP